MGAAAVAAFLYAPAKLLERSGEDAHDAGFRFDRLGIDTVWALAACALVLPLFTVGFALFVEALPGLPEWIAGALAPYRAAAHPLRFHIPLSAELGGRVLGNAAVALAEEFFYRGYLTLRLEQRWPPRTHILGARIGRAAFLAAALFALGHLLEPAPRRLFVFFPALVFAWLRARTGTIAGAAACHFAFNVALLFLEEAAFG